jgi:hypothetical protein
LIAHGPFDPPCDHTVARLSAAASTASRPASVTIAIRPSVGWDGSGSSADFSKRESGIFFEAGLDTLMTSQPDGQISQLQMGPGLPVSRPYSRSPHHSRILPISLDQESSFAASINPLFRQHRSDWDVSRHLGQVRLSPQHRTFDNRPLCELTDDVRVTPDLKCCRAAEGLERLSIAQVGAV